MQNRNSKAENGTSASLVQNGLLAEAVSVKPILFSGEMVRAILEGRKTQTRRIVKMRDGSLMQDDDLSTHLDNSFDCVMDFTKTYPYWQKLNCPYGNINDVLWVRETFQETTWLHPSDENYGYIYKASENGREWAANDERWKWKPSLFMPKSACRLFLKITKIRIERLQDISEQDAISEGIDSEFDTYLDYEQKETLGSYYLLSARDSYESLWAKINGQDSWDENPFVWVISFEITERPQGFC